MRRGDHGVQESPSQYKLTACGGERCGAVSPGPPPLLRDRGRGVPLLEAGLAQASRRLWSGGQGWGRLDVGPTSAQDPLKVRATRVHWQPAKAGAPSRKCGASSLAAGGPGGQGRGGPAYTV